LGAQGEVLTSACCVHKAKNKKTSAATLRTMVAIPATSILKARLGSIAMGHFWRQSSCSVDLDHGLLMRRGLSSRHHRDTVPAVYDDGGSFS